MTLDEAIDMYTSNAEYERTHENLQGCLEFRQLTEWLKELKQLPNRAYISQERSGMKLIINISDKDYEKLKDGYIQFNIFDVMRNGIPISDNVTPCDFCRYNPPSSTDGKPCCMCPATERSDKECGKQY